MWYKCTGCGDELDMSQMLCGECNPPSSEPTYVLKENQSMNCCDGNCVNTDPQLVKDAVVAQRLKPLHDRVVIKQDAVEEQTVSGIIIPTQAQEKQYRGTVLAVGPGAWDSNGQRVEMSVAVGDKVLYGKYAAQEVKVEGETYLIVKEAEVYAVLG